MNKKIIGIYTDQSMKEKLKKEAKKSHRSVSGMIIMIIEKYFQELKPKEE